MCHLHSRVGSQEPLIGFSICFDLVPDFVEGLNIPKVFLVCQNLTFGHGLFVFVQTIIILLLLLPFESCYCFGGGRMEVFVLLFVTCKPTLLEPKGIIINK